MLLSNCEMHREHFFNGFMRHFICSINEKVHLIVENQIIFNSPCEKLLRVRLHSNLTVAPQINGIRKKTGLKLNALAGRIWILVRNNNY